MSVIEKCPSYRESNKGGKERQGPTLGVRFKEVSVLYRCPLRESRLYFKSELATSKKPLRRRCLVVFWGNYVDLERK